MTDTTALPIWYELQTTDTEAAKRFYGPIVGWTAADMPSGEGMPPYTILNVGETGIGGLVGPMPGGEPKPATWLAYLHVADVDAKMEEVHAAGGTVAMGGYDIPGVGRIALVADPQGVPFYLMTPAPPPGMEGARSTSFHETLPGRCSWNELVTSDDAAALAFYGSLLGWTSNEVMAMGPAGNYTFLDAGDVRLGAMMKRSAPEQPLKWTFYFRVPDADRAAQQVIAGGGQVVMGPIDVPGPQRIVLAIDPQGASVGFVAGAHA